MMLPRPNRTVLGLLLLGIAPAAAGGRGALVALALDALVLTLYLLDAWLAAREPTPVLQRQVPGRLTRNKPFAMILTLHNRSGRALGVQVWDRLPAAFAPAHLHAKLQAHAGAAVPLALQPVPLLRGTYPLPPPLLEYPSPLGLGTLHVLGSGPTPVQVLPDTQALSQFDALLRQRRLARNGRHPRARAR